MTRFGSSIQHDRQRAAASDAARVHPAALQLRPLRLEDEASFRAAMLEFRAEQPPWDFALDFDETLLFPDYVARLDRWSRGEGLPAGRVPATFFVAIVEGEVVGRVSLRHELNEFLSHIGGHIGYGVRPARRNQGYATEMLRQALVKSAELGIQRALVTCDVDNIASRKVIERCGGILEGVTADPAQAVQKRRYWINTPAKS